MPVPELDSLKDAIIRVGDGRGFLVPALPRPHYVITAAHCLPELPPATGCLYDLQTQTFFDLLGPRDEPATIAAQCLFVDPISDVAVLGAPDGQNLPHEEEAYLAFMEERPTVCVRVLDEPGDAWLLTRQDRWERCQAEPAPTRPGMPVTFVVLVGADAGNVPGCSGSPIVTASGEAVGLISGRSETLYSTTGVVRPHERIYQPMLAMDLPAWFLADMRRAATWAPEEWLPAAPKTR